MAGTFAQEFSAALQESLLKLENCKGRHVPQGVSSRLLSQSASGADNSVTGILEGHVRICSGVFHVWDHTLKEITQGCLLFFHAVLQGTSHARG